MGIRFLQQSNHFLVFALACFVLISSAVYSPAQVATVETEQAAETEQEDQKKSDIITGDDVAGDSEPGKFRTEIEPGVVIFGKSNRFASVGNTQSFDSSPDGRTLVFAASKIKFFDLETNEIVDEAGENGEHYSKVRYSPDGRQVFATTQARGKSFVRVFDAIDMTSTGTIDSKIDDDPKNRNMHFYMQTLSVSADAKYVAFGSHDSIQVRNVSNGELVYHGENLGYVQHITFTPDEKYAIFPKNHRMVVIELETGEEQEASEWPMVGKYSTSCSVNLSRNMMVCAYSGQALSIYDLDDPSKDPIQIKLKTGSHAQSIDFSDDGSKIALSVWRQFGQTTGMAVDIVDVDKKKVTHQLSVASQGEMTFRFSPGNKSLFVSGHGIFGVKEIPISKDSGIEENNQPSGPAKVLAMHPDGEAFLACSEGGEVCWVDMTNGEVDRSIQKYNINGMEFNEDGSEILIATQWTSDDPLSRIRFKDGKQVKKYSIKPSAQKGGIFSSIRKFMVGQGPLDSMEDQTHNQSYSIAGNYLNDQTEVAMIAMNQTYKLVKTDEDGSYTTTQQEITLKFFRYDVETGRRVFESQDISPKVFGLKNSWIQIAKISPDGSQFVLGENNQAYVIDSKTGELIEKLSNDDQGKQVMSASYSPDGKFLALANQYGVDVYDTESFERVYEYYDEKNGVPLYAFSSAGNRMLVASPGQKNEVRVVNTKSWKKVFSRSKTAGKRSSVALSKDGQRVLIGLGDCRVEMWDLAKAAGN